MDDDRVHVTAKLSGDGLSFECEVRECEVDTLDEALSKARDQINLVLSQAVEKNKDAEGTAMLACYS